MWPEKYRKCRSRSAVMSAPSISGSSVDTGDEDSQESSSSTSLQTSPCDIHRALDEFRSNWERELKQHKVVTAAAAATDNQPTQLRKLVSERGREIREGGDDDDDDDDDVLDVCSNSNVETEKQSVAESLFRKAVELEQRGKVYDALPFYRKAIQIVPDIEFKYYEHHKLKPNTNVQLESKQPRTSPPIQDGGHIDKWDNYELPDNLYEKFQRDLARDYNGKLLLSSRAADVVSTEMHISDLPPELLLYILRWVVSAQLDMRSLERCAAVCKGMYLCARDEELWRLACIKVWGHNVGSLSNILPEVSNKSISKECIVPPRYMSWRKMFIERERVHFNGCYISKTTYLRMGENSFQDQYYRPVQLVEYYRYLRFLPDGTVLMMTNADEPAQGVSKLKYLQQLNPDILKGQYRLYGSTISIVLSKQQHPAQSRLMGCSSSSATTQYMRHRRGSSVFGGEDNAAANSTKYCIEFRILNTSKRKFAQLVWLNYSIVLTRNRHESSTDFDLTPSKYPPMWFSPVRSYHLIADAPLI